MTIDDIIACMSQHKDNYLVTVNGHVRSKYRFLGCRLCPMQVEYLRLSGHVRGYTTAANELGLTDNECTRFIRAADNRCLCVEDKALRARMLEAIGERSEL